MWQKVTRQQVPGGAAGAAQTTTSTMASQSQGVQQLLAAEKKAAEKVAEARKREYQSKSTFSADWPRFCWVVKRVCQEVLTCCRRRRPPPDPALPQQSLGRCFVPLGLSGLHQGQLLRSLGVLGFPIALLWFYCLCTFNIRRYVGH